VAVPPTAIRRAVGGKRYVLVVEQGRIGRRDVTTGATDEQASLVEIISGLVGGETVILGPASGLEPGQRVTVTGGEG
jgi:multidrug efflux pump subunit AcrA (membrane-fusion protein)